MSRGSAIEGQVYAGNATEVIGKFTASVVIRSRSYAA